MSFTSERIGAGEIAAGVQGVGAGRVLVDDERAGPVAAGVAVCALGCGEDCPSLDVQVACDPGVRRPGSRTCTATRGLAG